MSFRKISYSLRGIIWLITIALIFSASLGGAVELRGGRLSGSVIFLGIVSAIFFAWTVWSSVPPEN